MHSETLEARDHDGVNRAMFRVGRLFGDRVEEHPDLSG